MPFKEVVAAGVYLVREALRSPNFVTGVSGWTVNRDGSAEFNNVVVRGTVLASIFQSNNYVPGVSGFQLNGNTGSVEINGNLTLNDGIITGGQIQTSATGNRVVLREVTSSGVIEIYTGDPAEDSPASLAAFVGGGFAQASFIAPTIDGSAVGGGAFFIRSPSAFNSLNSSYLFTGSTGSSDPGYVLLCNRNPSTGALSGNSNMSLFIYNQNDLTLTSLDHPLSLGAPGSARMALDQNEIQAISSSNTGANLFLNNEGGNVRVGGTGEGTLGNAWFGVPAMRPDYAEENSSQSTTSTSFVALSPSYTFVTVPPTGYLRIDISADIDNSGANNSRMSFEIRNQGLGSVLLAASDARAALINGTVQTTASSFYRWQGTPGDIVAIRPMFRATAGTANFDQIKIMITPCL